MNDAENTDMKYEDLTRAGKELYDQGRFKDARTTLSEALDAAITESASDTQRASIKLELGKCCRLLAEFSQAEALLSDAMEVLESSGDPGQHALCLNHFALVLKDLADYEEAIRLLDKALAIAEKTHGVQHQDVAEILNNLGLVHWKSSRDEKAMEYYDRAVSIQRSVAGEENQLYGEIIDNIGVMLQRLGRFEEAIDKHKTSLEIREKCLSQDHPDIGYALLNLAAAKARLGDTSQTETMSKRAVACFEQGFGDCPDTAAALSNLGSHYLHEFRLDEALDCFKRSLSIKESVLDHDHPDLAIINHNMASVYKLKGNAKESKLYSERACKLLKSNMEREDSANVDTIITLADSLHAQGNEKEAVDLLTGTLEALEKNNDNRYERVLEMLGAMHVLNTPETAKEYLSKLLRCQKKELGPKHPNVAKTLRSLSNAFAMQMDNTTSQFLGNQAKAIEFKHGLEDLDAKAMMAMMARSTESDEENPDEEPDGISMRTMVTMLRLQGKDDEADKIEEEQQQKVKEKLGANSAEYADYLRTTALGSDYDKSLEILEEVLSIQEGNPEITLEDKLKTRSYMVMPLLLTNQNEKAENFLLETLAIEKTLRGEDHWTLAGTLGNLVTVLENLRKPLESEKYKKQLDELPKPTPEEEEEHQRKIYLEMERQFSTSLAGLGSVFQGLSNILGTELDAPQEDAP